MQLVEKSFFASNFIPFGCNTVCEHILKITQTNMVTKERQAHTHNVVSIICAGAFKVNIWTKNDQILMTCGDWKSSGLRKSLWTEAHTHSPLMEPGKQSCLWTRKPWDNIGTISELLLFYTIRHTYRQSYKLNEDGWGRQRRSLSVNVKACGRGRWLDNIRLLASASSGLSSRDGLGREFRVSWRKCHLSYWVSIAVSRLAFSTKAKKLKLLLA